MRSLSVRNKNFLRLKNPVSVCSWVGVSSDCDCLVTGHEDGSIGFTWLPTTTDDTPHSTILVYENIRAITHIATASHHNCVACVESNGNLLLLRINGPRVPAKKLASLASGAVEMVLGVSWSHSGTSLATLRYTHIGKTLSLRVYSGLNAPENQPSTVTIILPKTMTGKGMAEGATQRQQRVAWGKDGGEDIIISLTNNSIILVSTKSWQVVSQVKLPYSPRIFTASEGTIFALNNDKTLCFKKASGQVSHFTQFSVDTCTWVSAIAMLVAAARDASRQMIMFINKDGERVSLHPISTACPVLDIAWREGKNSIVYSTEEGLYSLLFCLGVPSLKELAAWVVEDGSQLPRRIKYEVQLSQSSLLYPQYLLDTIELDVSISSNNKRKVLRVSKKYLGQDLDVFYLKQPKFLHKKNFKLHRPTNKHSDLTEILKRQLPESVFSPPTDTVVIPGKNRGDYSITRQNELLQITTKDAALLIRIGSNIVRGEVRQEDGKSTLVIEGEESSQILGGRHPFGLVLLSKSKLALFDLLLLSLVYILHSY